MGLVDGAMAAAARVQAMAQDWFTAICDVCEGSSTDWGYCHKCRRDGFVVLEPHNLEDPNDVYFWAERVCDVPGNREAFNRAVAAQGFTSGDFDPSDLPKWVKLVATCEVA